MGGSSRCPSPTPRTKRGVDTPPSFALQMWWHQVGARTPALAYRWEDVDYHRDCLINAQAEAGVVALVVTPVPPASTGK